MYENKKILILGFARSGYEAAKYLIKHNNIVYVNDFKEIEYHEQNKINELKELGVKFIFGEHPDDLLDDTFDYLIKNPGIKIDHKYVLKAKELKVKVINEVEMAYNLLPKCTLIGITGTNGKTTTTTLTYNILHNEYKERVHLVGNIGYPLISIINKVKENDIIVMEVSCQQSENIITFKPNIALMTNYDKAHIDFFKTYEYYKEVKSKMFYNQNEEDIAVLNLDNNEVLEQMKNIKSKKYYFSSNNKTNTYHDLKYIYYNDEPVMEIEHIKIPGEHNIQNIMGAITISKLLNVTNSTIDNTISNFYGVEHRLEFINEINNIRFYNDTEATNIKCTQIALSSFNKPIILILGGLERGQDFNELDKFIKNVKSIIAIGSCRDRVEEFSNKNNIKCYKFEYLKDSFNTITNIMEKGDIVLLSPASASWDQYKECEERGKEFKDLVNNYIDKK